MVERSSRIEPSFAPVVPAVDTLTVQVAVGADPDGVTELTVGADPPVFCVVTPKFATATFETGSEKVTCQVSGPALAGFVPVRLIELTVGCVVSNAYAWPVSVFARPFVAGSWIAPTLERSRRMDPLF
jgi:hypothetical protein